MITTNINGDSISADFISALTDENRAFDAELLISGSSIECSINRIEITKGSCGNLNSFSIGNVFANALKAEVTDLQDDIKGEEVTVNIGVALNEYDPDEEEPTVDSYEYITLGTFTITETEQNLYTTTIIGYGACVTKTQDKITAPATQTLANIASAIATTTGVTVLFDTGIDSTKTITQSVDGLTAYEALTVLAGAVGGYAMDTNDGNIKIYRFDDTATLSRTSDSMVHLPVVDEKDFEIDGVLCIVTPRTDSSPAVTYPSTPVGNENLIVENPYMTQELYTAYLDTLTGYTYRPATIGMTMGDPRLEGNDVVEITDENEAVYIVPCHYITHVYDGGLSTKICSASATETENDVASSATSLTEKMDSVGANANRAFSSAESARQIATDTAQYFWTSSGGSDNGAHVTDIDRETFEANPSGGNTLITSNGMAVRDGLTEVATFGASGAQIGVSSGAHSVVDTNGQRFYGGDGTVQLANIGYGEGASQGGTATAPYYTFGKRKTTTTAYSSSATYSAGDLCVYDGNIYVCHKDITTPESWDSTKWMLYIGNYSIAEGQSAVASNAYTHAEGNGSIAISACSHAEGQGSKTLISYDAQNHPSHSSHAEGYQSVSFGVASHAEGYQTSAIGDYSHAEGYKTSVICPMTS